MNITYKKLDEIREYENNPRKNDNAVAAVANSIQEFGFKVPILLDRNGVIVAGHTRYKAAKQLGLDEVPCLVADDLSDEQVRAFRLADNKTAEFSEWDFAELENELANIGDMDMSDFGFDIACISPDDFGTEFTLPSGDKSEICQMSFTFHEKQKELIDKAISYIGDDFAETFGNQNKNGNALYEVVRQWAEQKKL